MLLRVTDQLPHGRVHDLESRTLLDGFFEALEGGHQLLVLPIDALDPGGEARVP